MFRLLIPIWLYLSAVASGQSYLISPDRIWTYNMPTGRDVMRLESSREGGDYSIKESPFVFGIYKALHRPYARADSAGKAFVVRGLNKEALSNAHAVLNKLSDRQDAFQVDEQLTLVFYSLTFGRYVWLDSVEQSENEVVVNYRFVSHMDAESTTHFALIPLRFFKKGEINVSIRQLPPKAVSGTELPAVERPERIVSEDFTFTIVD